MNSSRETVGDYNDVRDMSVGRTQSDDSVVDDGDDDDVILEHV